VDCSVVRKMVNDGRNLMIISCGLFYDAVCASDHKVSNGLVTNEYEVEKTLKRSSYSLVFACRN
jgi:hypothetical protein